MNRHDVALREMQDDWEEPYKVEPKPEFIKADTGKNMLSLIEPQFIIKLGEILTYGAKKYDVDNWKKCDDPRRYQDALLRHLYAYLDGELIDPESAIEHTASIAFNIMALQYFDNAKK